MWDSNLKGIASVKGIASDSFTRMIKYVQVKRAERILVVVSRDHANGITKETTFVVSFVMGSYYKNATHRLSHFTVSITQFSVFIFEITQS